MPDTMVPEPLRADTEYGRLTHAERINGLGNPADGTGLGVIHTADSIGGVLKKEIAMSGSIPTPTGVVPEAATASPMRVMALQMAHALGGEGEVVIANFQKFLAALRGHIDTPAQAEVTEKKEAAAADAAEKAPVTTEPLPAPDMRTEAYNPAPTPVVSPAVPPTEIPPV